MEVSIMYSMFESVSRSLELYKTLGPATIASYERCMACQFDAIEKFFVHDSQKIRAVMSQAAPASTPEQWTDATLALLQVIVQTTHENIVAAFECNLELMRELQQQATEMQGLLSNSLKQPAGARNGGLNQGKRSAPKLVA
jgi:hypothetical protein